MHLGPHFEHPLIYHPPLRPFSGQPLIFNTSSRGFYGYRETRLAAASGAKQGHAVDSKTSQAIGIDRWRCSFGSRVRVRVHARKVRARMIQRSNISPKRKNLLVRLSRRHHVGSQATLVDKACRSRCRSRRERDSARSQHCPIMPIDEVRIRG